MENETKIKIYIRKDDKEILVEMPWSQRSQSLEVRQGTTPRGVLDMIGEMVEKINILK